MKRLALFLFAVLVCAGQDLNSVSRTASGNITGTNASCLGFNCVWIVPPTNANAVTVQISGTFTATVQFEASTTGLVYSSIAATNGDTSATATGSWSFPLYGYRAFRVRGSAYTSGTAVVSIGAAAATTAGTGGWTDDGSTITAAAGRDVSISGDVTMGTTFLGPCTGVAATDTSKIQTAIDATPGGGRVVLPPGTCAVTSLSISYPITLEGVGSGGYNSISLNAWKPGSTISCTSTTADCITVSLPASNTLGGVVLQGFQVVGNRDVVGASTGSCVKLAGGNNTTSIRDWALNDLYIRDCKEYGIRLTGNVFEGSITNVRSHNSVIDGLFTETNGGLPPSIISLTNFNAQLNRYGFNNAGGGTDVACSQCYFGANLRYGAVSTGTSSFIGGYFEANGTESAGTYDNLYITSGSAFVTGAVFNGGTTTSKYNIHVASGGALIAGPGNYYAAAATADIRTDSGSTGTIYRPVSTSATFVSDATASGTLQRLDLIGFNDGRVIAVNGQVIGWSDANFAREGAAQIGTNGSTFNAANLQENSKRALVKPAVPSTASDACVTNQVTFDTSFAYFCVSTNTWRRVAIAVW